jgi:hypothetical protein
MSVQAACPNCGREVRGSDAWVGREGKCPNCGSTVRFAVAQPVGLPPYIPPPPTPIPVRESWWPKGLTVWRLTLAVCVLAFLLTLRAPNGPLCVVHYLGLMASVGMVTYRLADRFAPELLIPPIVIVAVVASVYLWGRSDYSIDQYSERTKDGKGEASFTDYADRGDSKTFYRRLRIRYDDGTRWTAEGAFSESGKKHGEWKITPLDDWREHSEWYWYGEPVTEGQWHVLNRQ